MANNNMNNGLRNARVSAPSTVDVIVAELGKEKYLANNWEILLRELKLEVKRASVISVNTHSR